MQKVAATVKITNKNSDSLLLVNNVIGGLAAEVRENSLKRVDQRYPLHTKIIMGTREAGDLFRPQYEAWGVDISNTGFGLIVGKEFLSGKRHCVVMRVPGQGTIFTEILIRRSKKLITGIYMLGTTFVFDDAAPTAAWVE
jgi:hypothetical protein